LAISLRKIDNKQENIHNKKILDGVNYEDDVIVTYSGGRTAFSRVAWEASLRG
jgi:hypothetical protein